MILLEKRVKRKRNERTFEREKEKQNKKFKRKI